MLQRIACEGAVAIVDPDDGGRLVSLRVDGYEVIGAATPVPGQPERWFRGSFPMAPFAGLVRDSILTFAGQRFELPANVGPHSGHGLVDDRAWTITGSTASTLWLRIELDERWPWGGEVSQQFQLEPGRLRMRLVVSNIKCRMPAALGYHPWFRRLAERGDATFRFAPRTRFSRDSDGFPGQPGPDLGARPWDDVFTDLADDPGVTWPSGPTLRLSSDASIWTLFERCDEGFCIEPLTAPPNSFGTSTAKTVEPGAPLGLRFDIEW